MNELHDEFNKSGLSIVGVTGESTDKTEPWIEEHGARYPYAYLDKEVLSGFMKQMGMGGYPSAAIVNPKGKIVWTGHPSSISSSLVKKHMKGADKTPVELRAVVRNWPKEAQHVRASFKKGQLAKALTDAKKLPEEWNVAKDLEAAIERRVSKVKALHASGDYLGFTEAAKSATKQLAGLPEGADLTALVKEVKSDAKAKSVISGQKKLAKLAAKVAEARKPKDIVTLEKKVEKIADKHAGTFVEESAQKLMQRLRKKRSKR